jgi:hypothetical protein
LKLLPVFLIEATAFLLIIAETYFFFDFVVPVGSISHSLSGYTLSALLKLGLTFGLVVLWFVVMIGMTRLYIRSKTRSAPRSSS